MENDRRDRGVDVEYLPGILCAKLVICNRDDFSEAVVRNEKKKKKMNKTKTHTSLTSFFRHFPQDVLMK